MSEGKVYLVGAGPGDPGLVTLRAKDLVSRADVLVYDALANPAILRWAPAGCELVNAGKRSGNHVLTQDETNDLLVAKAREGKQVVRLKGGDPLVFGRGGEEGAILARAGIAFEIVPGISSAIAGPAYAGIPVTHRDHSTQLTILTGHRKADGDFSEYSRLASQPGTKVLLMAMENLGAISRAMIDGGQDPQTPAAAIQWATTARQREVVSTLENLAADCLAANLGAPAVVVIGSVVNERDNLDWFKSRPLAGKRVVVTRTREQAGELARQLTELGAEVIELPTIRIEPPTDEREFLECVVHSHTYDWLVFSSPNGVEAFFKGFFRLYKDIRSIGGARIAAVGPGTARKLAEYGLQTDLVPEKNFVAEGLVDAFTKQVATIGSIEHLTFLWVRAEEAREVIAEKLSAMGAIVDECLAYRTVAETGDPTGARADIRANGADFITFTSASTVKNFLAAGDPWPAGCQAISMGPITTQALEAAGVSPVIQSPRATVSDLVETVLAASRQG